MKRNSPEQDAEHDRGDDQIRHPDDLGGDPQRGHSPVMHAGDAYSRQRAAHKAGPARTDDERDDKATGYYNDRDAERKYRDRQIVADRETGGVGQHGDKMGRPG